MKNETQSPKQPNRSLRLTFSYEGSDVRLVSMKSIEMLSPPSDPIQTQEGQAGFWYELRDAEGLTLYRRVIQNPIKFASEVRSDNPKRPLEWRKVIEPRGDFVLIVPDLPQAKTVKLFSSPLEPEGTLMPASELTHFSLKQVPEGKGGK